MDRSDPIFVEENDNLTTVENQIDTVIAAQTTAVQNIKKEIQDLWICSDYESVSERKALMDRQRTCLEQADVYSTFKSSPYFGRMDFDVTESGNIVNEGVTYFIGKADIQSVDKKQVVVDWRNPVGTFFYQKTQKRYKNNEYTYTLLLRRALDIQNAELVDYETEYDGEDISLDGEVIDPFLLTVLKDKRRQTRLTDIIRTIQDNQNSIIRRPYGDCFVVQGCAGSGKTMILLHRLSFLMYNNPKLPLNNIKIITPNKFFDEHIDELSRELGLAKIERYTIDEYYFYLIQKYARQDKPMPIIRSEKSLNEALLRKVYSTAYADELRTRYHSYWVKMLSLLEESGFSSLCSTFSTKAIDISVHNADTYAYLIEAISSIANQIKNESEKAIAAKEQLDYARSQVEELKTKQTEANDQLAIAQKETRLLIEADINIEKEKITDTEKKISNEEEKIADYSRTVADGNKRIEQATHELHIVKQQYHNLTEYTEFMLSLSQSTPLHQSILTVCSDIISDIQLSQSTLEESRQEAIVAQNQYSESVQNEKIILELIRKNRALYIDYDNIIALPTNDYVKEMIQNNLHDQIVTIRNLTLQFEQTPRYNFARRNRDRNDLQRAKEQYTSDARQFVDALFTEAQNKLLETQHKAENATSHVQQLTNHINDLYTVFSQRTQAIIEEYANKFRDILAQYSSVVEISENKISQAEEAISEAKKAIRTSTSLVKTLLEGLQILDDTQHLDTQRMTEKARKALSSYSIDVNRKYEQFIRCSSTLTHYEKQIPELEITIRNNKNGITEDTILRVNECKRIIDQLSYLTLEQNVGYAQLVETYREFNQNYSKYSYRHKMYLRLFSHVLYYRQPPISDNFLNIDEAQDISIAEYQLLSRILGPQCCFNLYGDVNQAVYNYKGISVWEEDIPDIIHGNVFMLNENYRNTIQVTDYCNSTFDVGMTAIGIRGDDVIESSLMDAIAWIVQKKKEVPEARAAIIYRHGVRSIQNRVRTALKDRYAYSMSIIDDKKISVVSTEMAKGLEFEYVIAITDQMSENEQYVAYTRALESLVVVNEKFAHNTKEEDDEEIEQDNQEDPVDNNSSPPAETPTGHLTKRSNYSMNQQEMAAGMMISELLEEPRYKELLEALEKNEIKTVAELMDLNLWTFMNRNRLYSIKDRFAVKQEIEEILQHIGAERTSDTDSESVDNIDENENQTDKTLEMRDDTDTYINSVVELEYAPSDNDLIVEQMIKDADLYGIAFADLYRDIGWSRSALWDSIDRNPKIINVNDVLYHQEALIDWNEACEIIDIALEKLLISNSFINRRVLYDTVRFDLDMFMNDNSLSGEETIFALARHMFEKVHYKNKRYWFYSGQKISKEEDSDGLSNLSLSVKYAQEKGATVSYDELIDYFESNGLKTGNFRTQLLINMKPVFLVYQPNEYILAESIGIDDAWLSQVHNVVDTLLNEAKYYIVLRDLSESFFTHLPSLPYGLSWTPLLFQQILLYWGKVLGARTIGAWINQDSNTLHAFIVPYGSIIETFPQAVAIWVSNEAIEERRYYASELRQIMIKRGIIGNGELGSTFVKSLSNDPHFAWDHDEKTVLVKGEVL